MGYLLIWNYCECGLVKESLKCGQEAWQERHWRLSLARLSEPCTSSPVWLAGGLNMPLETVLSEECYKTEVQKPGKFQQHRCHGVATLSGYRSVKTGLLTFRVFSTLHLSVHPCQMWLLRRVALVLACPPNPVAGALFYSELCIHSFLLVKTFKLWCQTNEVNQLISKGKHQN